MSYATEVSKREVFSLLRAKGAVKAVLSYNGGGDEGGVDEITLHVKTADGEIVEVDHPGSWDAEGEDGRLSKLLEAPVDHKYGSWAGDFEAYGTLTWDVEAGTVVMDDHVKDSYRDEREEW